MAQLTTYLSPYVHSVWAKFNASDSLKVEQDVLSKDGLTINVHFVDIESLSGILTDTTVCNEDGYKDALRLIASVGDRIFTSYSQLNADILTEYLRWTHNEEVFLDSLKELQAGGRTSSVGLGILQSTAVLERALGNVFLLRSKQVPSLMKDLLVSNELSDVFGSAIMSLLQLLLGSPKSLNVRNILWHGFAAPHEIPSKFGYLIIGATATLGRILKEKNLLESVRDRRRPQISLEDSVDLLNGIFPNVSRSEKGLSSLKSIFEKSSFIPDIMFSHWTEALDRTRKQRYGEAITLVLPQLEHSLRCLYATLNECPERLVTAQSTEFYTTFDEILARNHGTEDNKLIDYLGDETILAIQDVLVFSDGPRLRDRLSHGELFCVETVHWVLANHILSLALYFAALFLNDKDCACMETEVREVRKAILNYKPVFHPFSITLRTIVDVYGRSSGPRWMEHLLEVNIGEHVSAHRETANLVISRNRVDDSSMNIVMKKIFDGTLGQDEMKQWTKEISCLFLHRPRIEWEVLGLLRRSASDLVVVGEQVEQSLKIRSRMLEEHQLRSRQRATYLRMTKIIPFILVCVRLVVIVICGFMLDINTCGTWNDEKQESEKRFLRLVEKYAQNLKRLSSLEKNRWNESKSITTQFLDKLLMHYSRM